MNSTFKPIDFAQMPSVGNIQNIQNIPYNWERQSRVSDDYTIYCGSKQTFDYYGKPNDSTNGSGNTMQSFDYYGKANDSKRD